MTESTVDYGRAGGQTLGLEPCSYISEIGSLRFGLRKTEGQIEATENFRILQQSSNNNKMQTIFPEVTHQPLQQQHLSTNHARHSCSYHYQCQQEVKEAGLVPLLETKTEPPVVLSSKTNVPAVLPTHPKNLYKSCSKRGTSMGKNQPTMKKRFLLPTMLPNLPQTPTLMKRLQQPQFLDHIFDHESTSSYQFEDFVVTDPRLQTYLKPFL